MKKTMLIVVGLLAVGMIITGIYLSARGQSPIDGAQASPSPDPIGSDAPYEGEARYDLSAVLGMNDTYQVQQYALTLRAVDTAKPVEYVFGGREPVEEAFEEEEGLNLLNYRGFYIEDEDSKYIEYIEYRNIQFMVDDFAYQEPETVYTLSEAERFAKEALSACGLPLDNFGGAQSAIGVFTGVYEDEFFFPLTPVDGIQVSPYSNLGIYFVTGNNGLAFLYYHDYESIVPAGDKVTTLSASQAAAAFDAIPEEERILYGDMMATGATLVYDIVYVAENPDKAKLVPIWDFTFESGMVLQVNAITGVIWDSFTMTDITLSNWDK